MIALIIMAFSHFREANQLSEEMKRDTEFAVTLQVHIVHHNVCKVLSGDCS